MKKRNISHEKSINYSSKHFQGDARVSKESVFSDNLWDFTNEIQLPTVSKSDKCFNFDRYLGEVGIDKLCAYKFIVSIKDFCYARLHLPLPSYEAVSPLTVKNNIVVLKSLVFWCLSKNIYSFDEITSQDMELFKSFLSVQKNDAGMLYSDERIQAILVAVNQLYLYRDRVSWPLNVTPITSRKTKAKGRTVYKECRTPIIPDSIYKPTIRVAYNYIMFYSQDILCMLDKRDEIIMYLENIERSKGLTQFQITPYKYNSRFTPCLQKGSISINPETGEPWRETWGSINDFDKELTMLRNAAWYMIISLSGMRLSEFLSIEVNSVTEVDNTNEIKRFYLYSYLHKGQKRPIKEKWVVNEVVYHAIAVLERLTNDMRVFGQTKNLILVTPQEIKLCRNDKQVVQKYMKSVRQPSDNLVTLALNNFCIECSKHIRNFELSNDFHFSSRSLRRTLARHIAREPFGIIAGKLQYKHAEVAMFEGYAGYDESFLNELNEERASAAIDFFQDVIDDINNGEVYSARTVAIANEFRGVATEYKTLDYYLKSRRMMVYPGLFSYCFFDPDAAMCLKDSKTKKEYPILNSCRPDKCANSCITSKHIPLWRDQILDAKAMLNNKQCSQAQKLVLQREIADLERAILPFRNK